MKKKVVLSKVPAIRDSYMVVQTVNTLLPAVGTELDKHGVEKLVSKAHQMGSEYEIVINMGKGA